MSRLKTFSTIVLLLLSFLLAGLIASCTSKPPAASPGAKRYEIKGKVVSADRPNKKVTIDHQEIPGYMEAMTMAFTLPDDWAYEHLAPGADIQATLVVDTGRSWLEQPVITSAGPAGDTSAVAEPRPGDEVPDFTLLNQDGRKISFNDYRGRALVVTFIYTRCPLPDYCPLMTSHFAEIKKTLDRDPKLAQRTQLLSITVDPEYDTPRVLKSYRTRHSPDGGGSWEFATGTADEIKAAAQFFGLSYFPEKDQIIHSLRTSVVSPDRKVVRVFRGNEWKPAEVLAELRKLIP
jgi:protein SCO1/2